VGGADLHRRADPGPTHASFPLTLLFYRLILLPAMILMLGGHYIYAEVPPRLLDGRAFGFTRNNYNRIDHFAQGFVPAILTREILRRPGDRPRVAHLPRHLHVPCLQRVLRAGRMVEGGADRVRGHDTQGDPWDTPWDIF
jgi:putative membrane protein